MPIKIDKNPTIGDVLHSWHIQEYTQYQRTTGWYVITILFGLFLILFGLFTGNFLFSLVIVLFGIILFLQNYQEPPVIPIQISEFGVVVSDRFYPYSELESFYIVYDPPAVKMLYIETSNWYHPLLRIPLYDVNPVEVRRTLVENLPEDYEKEEEPISDKISRGWGIH